MTLADIWHGHRFCQQDTHDQRSRRSTRHNKDVLEMDHRGLETAPDHKSSSASWETCSELESEQSRIDEDHLLTILLIMALTSYLQTVGDGAKTMYQSQPPGNL